MKLLPLSLATLSALALGIASAQAQPPQISAANNPLEVNPADYLHHIQLPAGFSISLYATGMEAARSMSLAEDGTLFVGSFGPMGEPAVGKVYAVRDSNGDGQGDQVMTILEGLNFPNGVAYRDGSLYVAEIDRILRYDNVLANLGNMPAPVVVNDEYPEDFHHGWKYINFGPDGMLYVPVGAPCNICEVEGYHGTITRLNADGSGLEVYARGVRNSVGFDWHPVTGELWFTDNGRDLWGDDRPPEELNHAPRPGMHFGFPHRYGKDLVDDEYPTSMTAADFTPAAVEFPAHNAGLGMEFYRGDSFPAEYRNQLLVAFHGSWNRDPIDGYKVRLVRFDGNHQPTGFEDFASGWNLDNSYWGRPVDVKNLPDGSVLVSDDFNGVIYRISYGQ